MKIEINKKYKTREEELEYVCYWVGDGEAHGAIMKPNGRREAISHTDGGFYLSAMAPHPLDLIEVKEKKQLTGFVVIYERYPIASFIMIKTG